MARDPAKYYEGEEEALLQLSKLEDPMARVIHHMSVRQLDMAQMMSRQNQEFHRLVEALDKSNGAVPTLREVVYGK